METAIVQTQTGPLEGRKKEGVYLFAGIPYAAPPLENLRFKAPRPHPAWADTRQAFKFGPAAPQVATGGLTDAVPVRWDEDCLTLNVSTPACDDGARAVFVWIHGGAYRTGQGAIPWYNGARFGTNADIVSVTINYRLGALGFTDLSHLGSEYTDSGVAGTLDQIAALEWVRDNIAAFGGDPERVTIAGESAGGFSVSTLVGCERAQGLFKRAIPQSGGAQFTLPKAAGEQIGAAFLRNLGVDDAVGLAAIEVDKILAAQSATIAELEFSPGGPNKLGTTVAAFYPVHGTPALPRSPLDAIADGMADDVAVLTGSNADETTLWGYGDVDADKLARIAQGYGASSAVDVYRQTRPDADDEALVIALTTDHMFRIPALRLAEARWPHTEDTWVYQFDWCSRAFEGRLKATHSLEIPFAFDNLDRGGVDVFIGPGELPQHVADVMHQAWCDFINNGDPGWPRYTEATRTTMHFNETSTTRDDPQQEEREAWTGIR